MQNLDEFKQYLLVLWFKTCELVGFSSSKVILFLLAFFLILIFRGKTKAKEKITDTLLTKIIPFALLFYFWSSFSVYVQQNREIEKLKSSLKENETRRTTNFLVCKGLKEIWTKGNRVCDVLNRFSNVEFEKQKQFLAYNEWQIETQKFLVKNIGEGEKITFSNAAGGHWENRGAELDYLDQLMQKLRCHK